MNTISAEVLEIGRRAREAARQMATLPGTVRQKALNAMAGELVAAKEKILAANQLDLAAARQAGLEGPMLKRLEVTEKVFAYMRDRLTEAAALPDPVGRILEGQTRPTGLQVERISVPIGVIGIIYESRPNVTADAAAVCLKAGNAVILRGGSEAFHTNLAIADAMSAAAVGNGLPAAAIQMLRTPGREAVRELLQLTQYVDLLIPRGGKSLIHEVAENSRIPTLKHYEGICHLYLAADAPTEMAVALAVNSKCERVEVCNALEKLLVDAEAAPRLLPALAKAFAEQGVELRGCERARAIVPALVPAVEADWTTEYLAPILAIKVIDGVEAAIKHINEHGSGHTDGIVTQRLDLADAFVLGVDSASVLVNASTRLSGGGDYGLGAVVGISTDRLHARGPVGPNELTTYKWVARGNGHLRK
jgi:glutamate-5-semialdehyde dehydrogenase